MHRWENDHAVSKSQNESFSYHSCKDTSIESLSECVLEILFVIHLQSTLLVSSQSNEVEFMSQSSVSDPQAGLCRLFLSPCSGLKVTWLLSWKSLSSGTPCQKIWCLQNRQHLLNHFSKHANMLCFIFNMSNLFFHCRSYNIQYLLCCVLFLYIYFVLF